MTDIEMGCTDLNGLIEGDFMYTDQLQHLNKEIILISNCESLNPDDNSHSDSIVIDDTSDDDEIKIVSYNFKTNNENVDDKDIEIIATKLSTAQKLEVSVNETPRPLSHNIECNSFQNVDENGSELVIHQTSLSKGVKKRFDSKKLIDLYCNNCNKVYTNVKRSKKTRCQSCKTPFKYRCTQCKNCYQAVQKAFLHVKSECELAQSFLKSFHCSACYYDTQSQENLNIHLLQHHAVEHCINCKKKCEKGQMKKHSIFECKAVVPTSTSINGEIAASLDTAKKRRGRKLKYTDASVFLNKYCKICDETKELSAGEDDCTCKICNSVLQHQCITCCKRFQNVLSAKLHVHSCNYPPRFLCSHCNYHTNFRASFISHFERKHEQKECEVCLTIHDSYLSLRKHEKYDCEFHPRFQGLKHVTKSDLKTSSRKYGP